MPYTISEHDQASVAALSGRFLGSIERAVWQHTIDEQKAAGRIRLVIDLTRVNFIDSTGIGLIMQAAEVLRQVGGDVRLAGMQARVKNLFVMSRLLGSLLQGYPTVEVALQSFVELPVASGRQ